MKVKKEDCRKHVWISMLGDNILLLYLEDLRLHMLAFIPENLLVSMVVSMVTTHSVLMHDDA